MPSFMLANVYDGDLEQSLILRLQHMASWSTAEAIILQVFEVTQVLKPYGAELSNAYVTLCKVWQCSSNTNTERSVRSVLTMIASADIWSDVWWEPHATLTNSDKNGMRQ